MVNKTAILIRSYLKKSLTQVIVLILLFISSSLLLNTFLYIQADYSNNYNRTCEELKTEDISFVYYNLADLDVKDDVAKSLASIDYVTEYEIENIIAGPGSVEFNDGELDNLFSLYSYNDIKDKKIGKYEILNDINSEGVIVSYLFKVSGGYEIGDLLSFRINENEYKYPIVGFYNNPTTGSVNCPDLVFILTDKLFDEVKNKSNPCIRIELNVKDDKSFDEALNEVSSEVSKDNETLTLLDANSKNVIKNNRYSNATLFEVILSAGSIVMIIVLLIIIFISLTNYINNSTKDLGTLKALGYTSKNIIIPIVLELVLIALVSSIVGASLSYLVLPKINIALESQIAIPYDVNFLITPFLISILIVCFMTFIITYLSVIKIKSIAPINAIRENKASTTKSSMIVTLDKTNLNVNSLIGLKGFFSSISRNIIILVAITAVSFLAGFTCFMYQNVIVDNWSVIELICGQISDSTLSVYQANEEILVNELKNNKDVKDYYLYTVASVNPKDYPALNAYVIEDTTYLNTKTILIDGKLPENENEIILNGAYANRNDLTIGDEMIFGEKGTEYKLTICGISQGAYYTGRDCYILRPQLEKIKDFYSTSYYVDLKENVDIDEFNLEVRNKLPNTIRSYVNQNKYLQSTASMYCSILYILAVVICILSLLIIIFVLYILVYILLRNKRREHGILKSIGYTSNQIIYQTILTILPTCSVAIVIGLLLSKDGVKNLLSKALNSIGIFNFGQSINTTYLLIAGAFLLIFTTLYTLILSLSIKKISPHDLFNNE